MTNPSPRRGAFRATFLFAAACGSLACGSDDAVGDPGPSGAEYPAGGPPAPEVLIGRFTPLPGYREEISGRASLFRGSTETRVSVQLVGLEPGTRYPAHVHQMPCAQAGGGHYKLDPSVEEMSEQNEIWPTVDVGDDGTGRAEVVVPHLVRGDAMSVVVHDPGANNAKLACADLTLNGPFEVIATGEMAPFAGARTSDESITGALRLARSSAGTNLELELSGLDPEQEYRAHVHALPCDVLDAGGHYKLDPANAETVAANELWPVVEPDAEGTVSSSLSSAHFARLDAQSVVIHRVIGEETPKVACASLAIPAYPDVATFGDAVMRFDAAVARNYDSLSARAMMMRHVDGTTEVELNVSGLQPDQEYPVHVHALPCRVAAGGGHYKLDPAETETLEGNEIWLPLATDASGEASSSAQLDQVARAEAQSIVIHDYADSEKLACVDLY